MLRAPFQILVLGDSLAQYGDRGGGWASILRDQLQGKAVLTNLGISGLNSRQVAALLRDQAFVSALPRRADLIVVMLGSNDASTNFQGTAIGEYTRHLGDILQFCSAMSARVAL